MDTDRLAACRSSNPLRFHPYPSTKPSARERAQSSHEEEDVEDTPTNVGSPKEVNTDDEPFNLEAAIYGTSADDAAWPRRRRSISTLVIDLALMFTRKLLIQGT
ncbi:hypothetical protein HYDPIDRAFT_107313 [Hydnomerulius pinastri MD-312]|nr:hypothetical protein HYDPIDRAFT_107313 [Hydnomerulius pinastri MD-312]